MHVYLSPSVRQYWITSKRYFSMQNEKKFMEYFFPLLSSPCLSNSEKELNIYDIQNENIPKEKPKSLNVILCVENCSFWKHYKHYNKYSSYGDPNVSIYLYNHIDKCVFHNNYIAIPILYLQIDYFEKYYNSIIPSKVIPFQEKKFCLIATSINESKKPIIHFLETIGQCDFISSNKYLKDKSCYHSQELINFFNQYKFVFVCENSIQDGYITEKIFNCFFSRTIPIYYGSKVIHKYFETTSFLCINDLDFKKLEKQINILKKNEKRYNSTLQLSKIKVIDTEDYIEKTKKFIKKKLV